MRVCTVILCLLVSLSSSLMPLASMHAHVFAAQAVYVNHHTGVLHDHEEPPQLEFITRHGHVHFGHSHNDLQGTTEGSSSVVDFLLALIDGVTTVLWNLDLVFLPIIAAILVLLLSPRLLAAFLRPPDTPPAPSGRRFRWRPPLRGPPSYAVIAH